MSYRNRASKFHGACYFVFRDGVWTGVLRARVACSKSKASPIRRSSVKGPTRKETGSPSLVSHAGTVTFGDVAARFHRTNETWILPPSITCIIGKRRCLRGQRITAYAQHYRHHREHGWVLHSLSNRLSLCSKAFHPLVSPENLFRTENYRLRRDG